MVHKYITQIFINYYNIIIELLKLFYTFVLLLLLLESHKNEYLILFLYLIPTVQIALNIN